MLSSIISSFANSFQQPKPESEQACPAWMIARARTDARKIYEFGSRAKAIKAKIAAIRQALAARTREYESLRRQYEFHCINMRLNKLVSSEDAVACPSREELKLSALAIYELAVGMSAMWGEHDLLVCDLESVELTLQIASSSQRSLVLRITTPAVRA